MLVGLAPCGGIPRHRNYIMKSNCKWLRLTSAPRCRATINDEFLSYFFETFHEFFRLMFRLIGCREFGPFEDEHDARHPSTQPTDVELRILNALWSWASTVRECIGPCRRIAMTVLDDLKMLQSCERRAGLA